MEIATESLGAVTRLRLSGELTIYHVGELMTALQSALTQADELELDLTEVSELDSAGFQQLYLAKREALRLAKQLRLAGHSEATRQVLELYRMEAYFGDPVLIPAAASAQ